MDDPRQRNINGNGTLSIPQFNPDAFKVISPLSLGVSLPESAGTEFTSGNNKQNLPFLYDPNKDLQSGIPGSLSEEIRNNESLNPMHRRALRDSDRLGGRSYNFDSKGVPTANREFEASQVSARLLSGGGVSSAESIGNVVSEAGKIREEIKERLERETEFIKGREAEIKRAEAEKTDLARHDRYLGIANLPYTFLHHAFNNRFWKQGIFAEPPTSLCKEQDKRIAEMRSEIDYRKSLVEGLKDSLSRVGTHLDELSETNRALSSETDPRRQLELSRTANTKTHELIRALEKGVGHDDKESKKSWDETRKNLNKSLNALQYQADLAVGVVEGAGKAVVIGGAIGATALTGGTIIPILAGTGVGAGASIGMSGVSLSSNLYFGSSEITLAGEAVKTAHDIKDAALYASGSVLAGAGLSSIARKVGLSRVGQVTTSALLRLGDYSLAKPVQMIMTRSAQSTAMVTKPIGLIFRGWKVGAMTELPAAAVDTYLLSTPDSLDPSGDLRDLKITTLQQQQRQFLFRVGLSAASAGMSYRMQGLKNAINKGPIALIPGLANSGDTILQQAARSPLGVIRRIPGEIVTVVEAPMTAAASLWADAGLTGWYYGTEKSASPEERKKQMQFVMTSALGGHVAGRTVGARVEKIQKARNEALIKADQRLLHHSNTDIRDSLDIVRARNDGAIVSVLASSPHVILSGAEKALGITAKNQKTVAVHVGDTPDLARVESTRQEARVGRRVASMSDNEIGGRIRNYNKPFSDIVEVHTKGRAFGSGGDSTLHSDRDNYQRQLVSTARDRASRLAVIGDVDDHGHAGRLSRYIDTFNNEINPASPRGGSLLDRFLRAVDKAQNPYGRNRAILQTDDIKIDKAVP
ncbi:MAG TPA: hypothetical protein PJ989_14475, partial [Oligoflexia bacterium]|nr:hypothetical protein [Oligoflexia bacterium]